MHNARFHCMKSLCAICLLALLSVLPARAQQRLVMSESDGFGWTKVMGTGQLVGALDVDDSVLVPTEYCYLLYAKGFLIADSCADDEVVGEAAYDTDGNCLIPASRGYLKIRPVDNKGIRYIMARTRIDGHYYWAVCDVYGHEVISPIMYSDLMESPYGSFYYTDKGFAVKYKKKYTYLHIYVDEDGRMYQRDEDGIVYLADYE